MKKVKELSIAELCERAEDIVLSQEEFEKLQAAANHPGLSYEKIEQINATVTCINEDIIPDLEAVKDTFEDAWNCLERAYDYIQDIELNGIYSRLHKQVEIFDNILSTAEIEE